MSKEEIRTTAAPAPAGAYSQGIRVGDFVYTAGEGPIDPVTGSVVGAMIEDQTERAIDNIAAILQEVGASLADVVKVTVHLADVADFARFNAVYERLFPEPRPARTTVGSTLIGILVEIDAVAYVPRN